jgi:hypothetical protein
MNINLKKRLSLSFASSGRDDRIRPGVELLESRVPLSDFSRASPLDHNDTIFDAIPLQLGVKVYGAIGGDLKTNPPDGSTDGNAAWGFILTVKPPDSLDGGVETADDNDVYMYAVNINRVQKIEINFTITNDAPLYSDGDSLKIFDAAGHVLYQAFWGLPEYPGFQPSTATVNWLPPAPGKYYLGISHALYIPAFKGSPGHYEYDYDPFAERSGPPAGVGFDYSLSVVPIAPPAVVNVVTHGFEPPNEDDNTFIAPFNALGEELNTLPAPGSALDGKVSTYVPRWDSSSGWAPAVESLFVSLLLPNPYKAYAQFLASQFMISAKKHAEQAAQYIVHYIMDPQNDLFSVSVVWPTHRPDRPQPRGRGKRARLATLGESWIHCRSVLVA